MIILNSTKKITTTYDTSAIFISSSLAFKIMLVLAALLSLVFNKASAQVNINNPSLTVYSCGTYPTPNYTLPTVTITETARDDFGPQNTNGLWFELSVSAPYQIKQNVGSISIVGANINGAVLTWPTTTTIRITFNLTGATTGNGAMDQISLVGLQIFTTATSTGAAYLTWFQGSVSPSPATVVINGGGGTGGGAPAYATLGNAMFPAAFAGNDQLICATSTTMGATAPVSGTGSWTWVGTPTGTITTPSSPTSGITGLTDGTYHLKWTTTNGFCTSNADVYITVQTTAGSMACLTPANSFANVTAITNTQTLTCPVAATSPTIFTLGGPDVGKFNVGDKVLVIQMQGAIANVADSSVISGGSADGVFGSITNYNGAGNYEYAIIATKSGSDVTFAGNLKNSYSVGAGKNIQLVTVPQIANYTVASGGYLLGQPWDRATGRGGVLIFEVVGTLTINGTISMDYRGFLGGGNVTQTSLVSAAVVKPGSYPVFGVYSNSTCGHAQCGMGPYSTACLDGPCGHVAAPWLTASNIAGGYKGDGIASDPIKYPYGHGAIGNGGGSGAGWNTGGGGGSNVCAGGFGGDEYTNCYNNLNVDATTAYYGKGTRPTYSADCGITAGATATMRGIGGYALDASTGPRAFMGGGGGGGNGDNTDANPGGNGGGIIMITASTIAGTSGTITAQGQIGYTDVSGEPNALMTGNADGTGGGGGGGSIILDVGTYSIGTLKVSVDGGDGGDNAQASACFGSGGGGGGGLVRYNAITSNVVISGAGGAPGVHNPGSTTTNCSPLSNYGSTSGSTCASSKQTAAAPIPQKICCSAANLGPDQSICGQASITLTNGTLSNTNKTFTWYKNGVILAGSPCTNCPTYSATTAGVYTLKVDSIVGGINYCSSTSSMVITNSFPTPYLGPNQVLCSPSYVNLAPINVTFPTGTTFSWTKNGTTVSGATTSTFNNATSGTYMLTATAGAGCGPTSSTIVLSSGLPTTVGACRATSGSLTLTASGGNGGPYSWFTSSTGGTAITTGSPAGYTLGANGGSLTTASLSSTTTFYVQDVATTNVSWGVDQSQVSGSPTSAGTGSPNYSQVFTVLQACTLNAVTISAAAAGTSKILTAEVRSGASITAPVIATQSITQTTIAGGFYRIQFATPIILTAGQTYSIDDGNSGVATGDVTLASLSPTETYPIYGSDIALGNMVSFDRTNNSTASNQTTTWGSFYDFEFSYTKVCDRVPVIAEIGGSCAALPISFSGFAAEKVDNNALLSWTTNAEQNNDYFLVQRSNDGGSFETIGKVEGNGTTYSLHNYSFVDVNIPAAVLYYRLKQVDKDDRSSITRVIEVNNLKETSINVYPNPFENGINVVLKSRYDYKLNIRITDMLGEERYNSSSYSSNDNIVVGQDLPDGMYILEIRSETGLKTFRIVKLSK
jgi:hypothetical protein